MVNFFLSVLLFYSNDSRFSLSYVFLTLYRMLIAQNATADGVGVAVIS